MKFAVSVAEVYNNDIFDLLSNDDGKRAKHEIVTSGEGNKDVPTLLHVYVVNTAHYIFDVRISRLQSTQMQYCICFRLST